MANNAYEYYLKMGAENTENFQGTYIGYRLPREYRIMGRASFSISDPTDGSVRITATSTEGYGTLTARINEHGTLSRVRREGLFEMIDIVRPARKDEFFAELASIANHAYAYRHEQRLVVGAPTYIDYPLPESLRVTPFASYAPLVRMTDTLSLKGVSTNGKAEVTVDVDSAGRLVNIHYSGEFLSTETETED